MDIVLLTGRDMPRVETEGAALVAALGEAGLIASVLPWDATPPGGWSAVPLVVVHSTWDYTGDRSAFLWVLAQIAAETTLVNPLEVIRWNSHKGYLLDLADAGVPVVPTRIFSTGEPVSDLDDGEYVVKPAVGAGARGAARVAAGGVGAAVLAIAGDALVQPLVTSVPTRGEVSLVYLGGDFSHALRKIPAPGDYRVQAYLGGSLVDHAATKAELAVAESAMRQAPGELIYARVDLVDLDEGPAVMELELVEPELFLRDELTRRRYCEVLGDRLRRR